MAEEEKNDQTTEETPEAVEETPAAEAPKEEAPKEEAPKEEAPAEEAPKDEAPAEEAPADDAPAEEDAEEGLDWKQKARLAKSRESGAAGPQRTGEDRQKERDEKRKREGASRGRHRARIRSKHTAGTGTAPAEKESVARKTRQGTVVSSKPDKTITVRLDTARRHPVYEKVVRQTSTIHVHDERNEAGEGDLVRVIETRPLSKLKRWRLEQIVEKAK
jgi:small subunit ribosomal protein S17